MDKRTSEYKKLQGALGGAIKTIAEGIAEDPSAAAWQPEDAFTPGYVAGYNAGYAASVGRAAVTIAAVLNDLVEEEGE